MGVGQTSLATITRRWELGRPVTPLLSSHHSYSGPPCTCGFGIQEKIRCGLRFFSVFLYGFAVFGPPLRPPQIWRGSSDGPRICSIEANRTWISPCSGSRHTFFDQISRCMQRTKALVLILTILTFFKKLFVAGDLVYRIKHHKLPQFCNNDRFVIWLAWAHWLHRKLKHTYFIGSSPRGFSESNLCPDGSLMNLVICTSCTSI